LRVQNVGPPGGVERVAGRRASGSWITAKWLVEKTQAHVEDGRLVPARRGRCSRGEGTSPMIRKLPSGRYRLYSRKNNPRTGKRRKLGTFRTRTEAVQHERAIQYFKSH